MKLTTKSSVFLLLMLLCSVKAIAQKVYTVNVGNERLLLKCADLRKSNESAAQLKEAEETFTNVMTRKIDSIISRCKERRSFIKDLKRINASALPTTFNNLKYIALNSRIERENIPLAQDMAYCDMLEKVLSLTDRFKKNKKVFFATSKYQIPESLKPTAKKIFQSAVDDLIRISNTYKGLPFTAVIKTTGYSDSTAINPESNLYYDMSQRLKSDSLSSDEINTFLSYLRAYDVSGLLEDLMNDKSKFLIDPTQLKVDYQKLGMGSQFPVGASSSAPSSKRRVVHVYWHILPNF